MEYTTVDCGMKINTTKTKVMVISIEPGVVNMQLAQGKIECVEEFKYLRFMIERAGSHRVKINERIGYFMCYTRILYGKKRCQIKLRVPFIEQSTDQPQLCEAWVVNRNMEIKTQELEDKYLSGGIMKRDRLCNEQVRKLEILLINKFLQQEQLSWWGHMEQINSDRLVK